MQAYNRNSEILQAIASLQHHKLKTISKTFPVALSLISTGNREIKIGKEI